MKKVPCRYPLLKGVSLEVKAQMNIGVKSKWDHVHHKVIALLNFCYADPLKHKARVRKEAKKVYDKFSFINRSIDH